MAAQSGFHRGQSHGLAEVAIHPGLQAIIFIPSHCVSRHRNNWDTLLGSFVGFQLSNRTGCLVSIQAGHLAVHQNEVVTPLGEHLKSLLAIADRVNGQAKLLQHANGNLPVHRVVLGNQNPRRWQWGIRRSVGHIRIGDFRARSSEPGRKVKLTSLIWSAVDLQISAHQTNNAVRDCQAQSSASKAPRCGDISLGKGREQALTIFWLDSNSRIEDGEFQANRIVMIVIHGLDLNSHLTFLREFHGIAHQIRKHLAEAHRIPHQSSGDLGMDFRF
ncbi:MAG: hypothetical protein MK213_07035 [Planctomycetes bacterium]|nr:hypothetical protein [Planctomycetota bacterium]